MINELTIFRLGDVKCAYCGNSTKLKKELKKYPELFKKFKIGWEDEKQDTK